MISINCDALAKAKRAEERVLDEASMFMATSKCLTIKDWRGGKEKKASWKWFMFNVLYEGINGKVYLKYPTHVLLLSLAVMCYMRWMRRGEKFLLWQALGFVCRRSRVLRQTLLSLRTHFPPASRPLSSCNQFCLLNGCVCVESSQNFFSLLSRSLFVYAKSLIGNKNDFN